MRKTTFAGLVLCAASSAAAHAADAPMQPGLWSMDIQGETHADPGATMPVQRKMNICIKPGQKPETVVIPAEGKQCTSSHATEADGKTLWTFHCDMPGAKVTQTGTFATGPTTFDSHWTITSLTDSGVTTSTTMQVTGKRLGSDCGSLK
ncbi:MAG: hypothetical protein B7Z83_09640 [Thiomonas sp. 20-64-5]|nr:MAG: hypothetical protein B7Z83_09640 [Thiomonas sp. 20-64-5]